MTDLEKFIELYKSFGIILTIDDDKYPKHNNRQSITLTTDNAEGAKIVGYSHFYTTLFFDLEGKFIEQGIWE